jgi:hypothetical protein
MGKVMEQLGIADAMAKKVIFKPALDGGAQLVVAGEAEIGIYPASEVAGIKGLTVVGPLPADINLDIVYGAGATADSAAPNAASAFVKFMAAPENRSVWKPVLSRRQTLARRVRVGDVATEPHFGESNASCVLCETGTGARGAGSWRAADA